MQQLIKGLIFRIVFTGVSFIVSLVIAKLAGTTGFGMLSLIIVNAAIIYIITSLGTDAAIVWHGASGTAAWHDKIFSFTIYSTLIQLVLFGVTAFFFYMYTGKSLLSGEKNAGIGWAELFYFSGLVLTEKYSALFYSQQQAGFCNRILAVSASLLLLVILAGWFALPGILSAAPVWIFCLFTFIPASLLVIFYQQKYRTRLKKISADDIRSFAGFSFIVLLTNLIQFVAFRADFWWLNYFYNKSDVGIYAQAAKFAQMLWMIPGVLAGLIIPALRNQKNQLSIPELLSMCRILFFTHIFLALLIAAGAFFIYSFFLPAGFFNGFPSLLIMIPGYILFIITTILAAFFSASRLLKINLAGSALCCLVMTALDLLLIPRFSFDGAAIANLCAYTITTIYFIAVFMKYAATGISDYFIIRKKDWEKMRNFSFRK